MQRRAKTGSRPRQSLASYAAASPSPARRRRSRWARQVLAELPARIDTRLLFPAPERGSYGLDNFRHREFVPAVDAAGLPESTTPYSLRHSGISWALAAGIPPTDVARFGGTSVTMLERTYAHLLVGSLDSARGRMDNFATIAAAADEAPSRR